MSTSTFHLGIFYVPQICDMGPTPLLPLRRKVCWGFFHPEKSWRLQLGLNPRTWVLKGSKLPLDHRSRFHSGVGEDSRFLWCDDASPSNSVPSILRALRSSDRSGNICPTRPESSFFKAHILPCSKLCTTYDINHNYTWYTKYIWFNIGS
jgi:hypothetical protein